MSIESIMTAPVVSINMDDSIRLLHQHFKKGTYHHIPVVNSHRQVQGIISDRDFLKSISPYFNTPSETRRDAELMLRRVHTIMTRNPVTVSKDSSLSEASKLLLHNGVSSLLVVDNNYVLIGIVTLKDIVRVLASVNVNIINGELITLEENSPEVEESAHTQYV